MFRVQCLCSLITTTLPPVPSPAGGRAQPLPECAAATPARPLSRVPTAPGRLLSRPSRRDAALYRAGRRVHAVRRPPPLPATGRQARTIASHPICPGGGDGGRPLMTGRTRRPGASRIQTIESSVSRWDAKHHYTITRLSWGKWFSKIRIKLRAILEKCETRWLGSFTTGTILNCWNSFRSQSVVLKQL